MAAITIRGGKLVFDFRYKNHRCREQTKLEDNSANRKRAEAILKRIEAEIMLDQFDYLAYFPKSKLGEMLSELKNKVSAFNSDEQINELPLVMEFIETWFSELAPGWRKAYQKITRHFINKYILPSFGSKKVDSITKAQLLQFRSDLTKAPGRNNGKLSNKTVNRIMLIVSGILNEAADRFEFTPASKGIKKLKLQHKEIHPLSLVEVQKFIANIGDDWKCYFTTRFFTGLRTGEIHALRWKNVDLQSGVIHVKEGVALGELSELKNLRSYRQVQLPALVLDALTQYKKSLASKSELVFPNSKGSFLDANNVSRRVWKPALKKLGMEERRLYETRHTTATFWLASGENPEWIAKQMGHSNTVMLFTVYSRYVPNLTRNDGSAFEHLLDTHGLHQEKHNDK